MKRRSRYLVAVFATLMLVLAACSDDDSEGDGGASDTTATQDESTSTSVGGGASGNTLKVPDDYATIQEAVDAAAEGSLILISPGTYNEAVDVTTDNLVIRGTDRNKVILDGKFELENGVRILGAGGVAVENLTAQNYTGNGVFWTGVDGYRGSYLTTIKNGDYGVYAFGSVNGIIEEVYASGSPDAGVYIGQCFPCNAHVRNVLSEWNGLGYSGTNSGGNLFITDSIWRNNRAGIVPNSGSYEGCAPETETTVVGNLVYDNNNDKTGAIANALLGQGNGILIAGGIGNVIERNRVWSHDVAGIALAPFPEDDPISPLTERPEDNCQADAVPADEADMADVDNPLFWPAKDNKVTGNVVSDSGAADLGLFADPGDGNCFADNEFEVSNPEKIEEAAPCGGTDNFEPDFATLASLLLVERPEPPSYKDVDLPDPGPQTNMPDAETAPAEPASNIVIDVDIASIKLPDMPADAEAGSGGSGSTTTAAGSEAGSGESTTTEAGVGTPTTVVGTTTTAG